MDNNIDKKECINESNDKARAFRDARKKEARTFKVPQDFFNRHNDKSQKKEYTSQIDER